MMNTEEAKELLLKYSAVECTEAEKAIVEQWIMQLNEGDIDIPQTKIEEIGREIYKKLPGSEGKSRIIKLWSVITAVAAISAITIGTLLYLERNSYPDSSIQVTDIASGGNKATLSFANGKTINLSTSKTGIVIDNEKIAYNDGITIINKNIDNGSGMVTISTPKGGEYQITLPDGTKVWLNAASTLEFPAAFRLVNRTVALSGEAYFEVAKDKAHPFIVNTSSPIDKAKSIIIEVLGTHFNINAYDPQIRTTLIEGAVRVSADEHLKPVLLSPGESRPPTTEKAYSLQRQTLTLKRHGRTAR